MITAQEVTSLNLVEVTIKSVFPSVFGFADFFICPKTSQNFNIKAILKGFKQV
ncbi:MAG: hypothetical protein ACJAV9_001518 [Urechidicola sp.]